MGSASTLRPWPCSHCHYLSECISKVKKKTCINCLMPISAVGFFWFKIGSTWLLWHAMATTPHFKLRRFDGSILRHTLLWKDWAIANCRYFPRFFYSGDLDSGLFMFRREIRQLYSNSNDGSFFILSPLRICLGRVSSKSHNAVIIALIMMNDDAIATQMRQIVIWHLFLNSQSQSHFEII